VPHHTLEVVLEVNLEITLEHMLGIKTMISLLLNHVATAYLHLGINTGEKVMTLFVRVASHLSTGSLAGIGKLPALVCWYIRYGITAYTIFLPLA
jgi:hypothetical protein